MWTISHSHDGDVQIKNYKTYVKREIDNQSRLRHPLIVSIQEVSSAPPAPLMPGLDAGPVIMHSHSSQKD